MKILERIILVIFSLIILMLSIVSCLVLVGWFDIDLIYEITDQILEKSLVSNIILAISILFIILSIKCIFFSSNKKSKEEYKVGVLLENTDGRLLISKDTIENLVNNVVKRFDSVLDVQTKVILEQENGIIINIVLVVKETAVIKDLSVNIQNKIKETIKRTSDLEAKQINVRIKNIEAVKESV